MKKKLEISFVSETLNDDAITKAMIENVLSIGFKEMKDLTVRITDVLSLVQESCKIVSVSSNTNSFGLYGCIIVSRTGIAYEIGVSYLNKPKKDDIIEGTFRNRELVSLQGVSYEIPRKLSDCSASVLAMIIWKP